jgi:hypothetical protein
MPVAAQSNIPYLASNYTAMVPGNAYKGAIDANSAILSPFGEFFVYENSPAGLTVLVDCAFNFLLPLGEPNTTPTLSSLQQQPTASPVVITLAAPGSNSYLACIYFDTNSNSFGVTYGPTAASNPILQMPDYVSQIPLAAVELTVGQTTVTSSNIIDLRGSLVIPQYKRFNLSLPTAATWPEYLHCNAADIYVSLGAAATLELIARIGTDIRIIATCTGSARNLKLVINTPGGVSITPYAGVTSNASYSGVNMTTTGIALSINPIDMVVLRSVWSGDNSVVVFA